MVDFSAKYPYKIMAVLSLMELWAMEILRIIIDIRDMFVMEIYVHIYMAGVI